jgi:hypothetical protein
MRRILGIIFLVAGIAGIAVGAFSFMGMQSLGGESLIGMVDYIEIGCSDTTPLKVFAAAVLLLPFVYFLYAGLVLYFKPDWKLLVPGLAVTVVWLVSVLGISVFCVSRVSWYTFYDIGDKVEEIGAYDTLYVRLNPFEGQSESRKIYGKSHEGDYRAAYVRELGDDEGVEFIKYPRIAIMRKTSGADSTSVPSHVDYRFYEYAVHSWMGIKAYEQERFALTDSLLAVFPRSFSKRNKYAGHDEALYIYVDGPQPVVLIDECGNYGNIY